MDKERESSTVSSVIFWFYMSVSNSFFYAELQFCSVQFCKKNNLVITNAVSLEKQWHKPYIIC